jgi:hypothetical protein
VWLYKQNFFRHEACRASIALIFGPRPWRAAA